MSLETTTPDEVISSDGDRSEFVCANEAALLEERPLAERGDGADLDRQC